MKYLIIFLLFYFSHTVNAAELFGINLTSATQDELRIAVKNTGVKLVQEAGVDTFYDVYKGGSVLHKAKNLYLGFVKNNKQFAFAEYEFEGLAQPVMLKKLTSKYGVARLEKGQYLTDQAYSWISNGIEITLYQDWIAHKMRLTYVSPDALARLKAEQLQFEIASNKQKSNYVEMAY